MNHILKKIAFGFLGLGILGLLYAVYLSTHSADITKRAQLASLLLTPSTNGEEIVHLDLPIKSSDCHINGSLPDHDCTPGAVFPDATKEKICVQGYSKTVRNVSKSLRRKVFEAYGIPYPPEYGTYENDHLIPLALGGNNDIANLFPEAAEPYPGFKEKDVVENYLHEQVCAGNIALSAAQKQIADNWLLIYHNLDPKVIEELKLKYRSWAR